ncbi:tyrosine/serine protein phosphatase [Pseudomassariella vexata]|uniref:Tyrosine/serine protein phosphatase n=1 Tax=Pseudomassariella vexata TaxID=1141098 RepID=A0A1Y2EKE3_9PEZI|nr:tyrosine/serine protein phosphatase [Pseudomassariella vexata]ORY71998.1 tyrosine/serine protein phosphatase [Pseudomassariella vexata]
MASKFDNILNFRDVGKTINAFLGKRMLQEGVLYRSARPDDASLADRRKLKDELGVKTLMDLRTKTEHLKQAEKRQADLRIPALLQSNAALAEPVQIPGMKYLEIKITGGKFEKFMLSQLSWLSYFKLVFLYLTGRHTDAIKVMSKEVMLPRGLVGIGLDSLDHSGDEIAIALRTFTTTPPSVPLLVHCTHGKDRTGIIICLVLMVLHVPEEAIAHDYLLTRQGFETERESRLKEIEEIGLTAEWGDCPTDFVHRFHEHVRGRFGGIEGYLDGIEFGAEERRRLVETLGA